MREYDRNLAVDGASRELGLTVSRVKAQFEELRSGNIKPPKKHQMTPHLVPGRVPPKRTITRKKESLSSREYPQIPILV
tara:strand:+ start:7671 stop:7907 length:237 start_codon:yes stop_codon:yes gene_type:complete